MKKKLLPLVALVLLCLTVLWPFAVGGTTPLDPDAPASLTLHYQKDGTVFPELQVSIYRVAQAFPDGSYELIDPFASYHINIHGITMQEQWNTVAQTICAYIVADQVAPDREGLTDANGTVSFTDLETGLYFVREVVADNSGGTYIFNQFMVYLPTPQQDGSFSYDVEARPKCTAFIPKTQYTVTKLWQDEGSQNARPEEVTVDIYHDGILHDTQILSAQNNWTYTWYVTGEDTGKWTVAERTVPDGYTVTVQQNGGVFTVINTSGSEPGTPPPTGDTFSPLPWILGLCASGIALLILGIYSRRRR